PEFGALPGDPTKDPVAGLAAAALGMAAGQAAAGHRVELWGLSRRPGAEPSCHEGVLVKPVSPWRWAHLWRYDFRYALPVLLRALRARPTTIAHVHMNPFLLQAPIGDRKVFHIHAPTLLFSAKAFRIAASADAVVCASHFVRNWFLAQSTCP